MFSIYVWIGMHINVPKARGWLWGWQMPDPMQHKICKYPTPGNDKAFKCPVAVQGVHGHTWNKPLALRGQMTLSWNLADANLKGNTFKEDILWHFDFSTK